MVKLSLVKDNYQQKNGMGPGEGCSEEVRTTILGNGKILGLLDSSFTIAPSTGKIEVRLYAYRINVDTQSCLHTLYCTPLLNGHFVHPCLQTFEL